MTVAAASDADSARVDVAVELDRVIFGLGRR
jgi:hypothetical protein